ncbi:MAG TPA: sialidase family protein [Candidatus Acidoferrales bacterium]|nr:sialidase family protein [Candidatus Acidoferrales bacterium]
MRSAKLMVLLCALASLAWAAPQFSHQRRVGLTSGDQWEPAVAADGSGRIYVLYPHYGSVPDCKRCRVPAMLLVTSNDNGKSWQTPQAILETNSGQFDAQIAVDPVVRRTLYAAWLQNGKRVVILAKSVDFGATWAFTIAVRSEAELDKPALAVRGQNVYVAFNHEEEVWVVASQDGGRSFTSTRVNTESLPGWSLLGAAAVDPAGNAYLAWASYSKAGGARGSVNLYVAKSADAGMAWSATRLDVSAAAPGCEDEECGEGYLGAQVALASDTDGTLYALWSAGSSSLGPQRIYFSSSTNAGENWLPRVSVSSAEPGVEHAFPAIVAGNAGDVRIAWMDKRNSSSNSSYWNTYYRSSSNGGATWGEETRISGYVPGFRYIGKEGFRFPFGDYFGLAIDNHGDTHVVWGEGMNYQSPGSIWHASGR